MFPEAPNRIISRYRLKEKHDLTDYSDDIELVFVELPKFQVILEEVRSLVDKWLYFLNCASQLETVPSSLKAVPAIDHAFTVAEQSGLNSKELELLEKREMVLHDNRNAILKAQQDALKQGLKQGLEQGVAEGEKRKALAIARLLLDVLDTATIAGKTGLSLEEVRQLAEERESD